MLHQRARQERQMRLAGLVGIQRLAVVEILIVEILNLQVVEVRMELRLVDPGLSMLRSRLVQACQKQMVALQMVHQVACPKGLHQRRCLRRPSER